MGSSNQLRQPGPLGQLPFDSYTIISLGFQLDNSQLDKASAALDEGSLKLTAAFPWLAAQVVIQGERTSTKSGHYAIIPYPEQDGKSLVRKKDCTDLYASYNDILAANAPFSMLDGTPLISVSPMGYNMSPDVPWPVLVIQASFINNGLILTFATQHNSADMTGQGRIITYFAQALRGDAFHPDDLLEGNRTPDLPLLPPNSTFDPPPRLLRESKLHLTYPAPALPPDLAPWSMYRISAARALELKAHAKAHSTNDAVSALYAQRLTDARTTAGLISKDETVVVDRAMNIRAQCGYSERYLGTAPGCPVTTMKPFQDLPTTAAALRKSLDDIDEDYARRFMTIAARAEDKTTVFYGAATRAGVDVIISSWAKLKLAGLGFGDVLGEVGFVRRPRFGPAPGLCYVLPRSREGDWEVACSLSEVEGGLLRADAGWREWMEEIV